MPTFNWDVGAGTSLAARARLYGFSGTSGVREGEAFARGSLDVTIEIPAVTTVGDQRLALAFSGYTGSVTASEATGETGGDYTEPVGEFTGGGGGCGISLQSAPWLRLEPYPAA